mgnify:CR=1 FL=1
MTPRNRKRLSLILIATLFAAPLVAAIVLHATGWEPIRTRNHGELVEPPRDLSAARFRLRDGSDLPWQDENWSWTLFAIPAAGPCGPDCLAELDELRRVRLSLNQNAYRVRLVALADVDDAMLERLHPLRTAEDTAGALADQRPAGAGEVAAVLVDPRGFLALRYPAGFDAAGLRKDIARLVKR